MSAKWQLMQLIVNQSTVPVPSNTCQTPQQFTRLRIKRLFADNLLVFLMQYIGLKSSTFALAPSPLWLATGSSCAYLFLRGTGVLPGIWLGSLFGFYFENTGVTLSLECASVLTLQALVLLQFSYRYLKPTLIWTSQRTFINYLFTAMLTATISLIVVEICYPIVSHHESFFHYWVKWWLANFNGIVILSSAMLTWDAYASSVQSIKKEKVTCLVFSALLMMNIMLACSHTFLTTTGLFFTIILMTLFISVRYGWCGAMAAAFVSGMALSFAGFLDAPLFSTYTPAVSLFLVQLFLCLNTIIGITVAMQITSEQ